jgi:hypothetical protein
VGCASAPIPNPDLSEPKQELDPMSINPTSAVLQSQRGSQPADEPRPWRKTAALFFQAIGEGLAAHRRYEMLVARGVPPNRAVAIAFEETCGQRRSDHRRPKAL